MPNSKLAAVILEQSLAWGVRDFVVCAGARNAPLILPLLDAPKEIRIWNHFDERAAAFFALGLAKRDNRPVAIVTTSGTAVAELLPATIEAHYSAVPLVLITADRPKRFRGTGAPQSILQPGLFGEHVEGSFDCESPEEFPVDFPWNRSRPIHLNPCFEEPGAEPAAAIDWAGAMARDGGVSGSIQPCWFGDPTLLSRFVADFERGIVLLGEIAAKDRAVVEVFLQKLGAPIWAEATSGLRESAVLADLNVKRFSRIVLGARAEPETTLESHFTIDKVLRIGGVPSLRLWRDLEDRREIEVFSVTPTGFSGLARASEVLQMNLSELAQVLVERPSTVSGSAENLDSLLSEFPRSEPALIRRLSEQIPRAARIFLGNSLPIREWNLAATTAVSHPDCFANRGANGIDGEVSTFLGLSEGAEESWGNFGDLTALYDLNAPWILDQLSAGKRRIVVINNGGGRIFSRLPGLGNLGEAEKRTTENRHEKNFESWAAMWGCEYVRADPDGRFSVKADHAIIEILPDALESEKFWEARQSPS